MSCLVGSGVICSKKLSLTQSELGDLFQCFHIGLSNVTMNYSWLLTCLPQDIQDPCVIRKWCNIECVQQGKPLGSSTWQTWVWALSCPIAHQEPVAATQSFCVLFSLFVKWTSFYSYHRVVHSMKLYLKIDSNINNARFIVNFHSLHPILHSGHL